MFFKDNADKCHFSLSFLSNATFNINECAIESRHSKELLEIAIDSNLGTCQGTCRAALS